MSNKYYSAERAAQILISLLKAHNINRVIASPGTTNLSFVGSIQNDPFFEIYSAADERSAAYMACGMAAEDGKPVVLSCTGATASRNYLPALTEAFYRKLPILAVTANSGLSNNGHLVAQYIDRTALPNDVAKISVTVPAVTDEKSAWAANVDINKAILELNRNGGGPTHINFSNQYYSDFSITKLPKERKIKRITDNDVFPPLPNVKTAVFIGSHSPMDDELTQAIDDFCKLHNAVTICDITSGYNGQFRVPSALIMGQGGQKSLRDIELLVHIGEICGDYYSIGCAPKKVWRVSEDGEIRDFFHRLEYVFDMREIDFFKRYAVGNSTNDSFLKDCMSEAEEIYGKIPELPFSNIWIAKNSISKIPQGASFHLGILNSLRSWNFFAYQNPNINTFCNVGGFGIDGILSTVIGASMVKPDKKFFCVVGDLAFFYDLNSLANRHVGANLRIMLINNGKGTEFTNYGHLGHAFGEDADPFIAAAGHYGNKSKELIKHYATDLGFEYLSAANKKEYLSYAQKFFSKDNLSKSIIFEIFTDSKDESQALEIMLNLSPAPKDSKATLKKAISNVLGDKGLRIAKILREK